MDIVLFIVNDEKDTIKHKVLKKEKYSLEDELYFFQAFNINIFDYSERPVHFNKIIITMLERNLMTRNDILEIMNIFKPLMGFTKKHDVKNPLKTY